MKVRLIKKLAECIDDIDLSYCRPGDVLELPEAEARLLVAEQWAQVIGPDDDTRPVSPPHDNIRRAS